VGEAVVSGMITPDNYIVEKSNLSRRDGSLNRPITSYTSDALLMRPYGNIQKNISNQHKKIVLDLEK
jgi:phosphoenolpyruvate synthase/pyruvate phosphate dikinase